jgi:hypothetical protein
MIPKFAFTKVIGLVHWSKEATYAEKQTVAKIPGNCL